MTRSIQHYFSIFLNKKQYFIIIIIILIFSITFTLVFYHITPINYPSYYDEILYIKCGVSLVEGTPPIDCNYEHPPLAKYLIGLFYVLRIEIFLPIILYSMSLLFLFKTIDKIADKKVALFSSILLGLDTLFAYVYMHYLLDPITLTFLFISLYFFIKIINKKVAKYKYFIILGLFIGLTLASKWQSSYIVLGILSWSVYSITKNKIKILNRLTLLATLISAMISYTASFIGDIRYGWYTIIYHNLSALEYMLYKHSFSPPIALIGFTKLFLRTEIWHYAGILIINNTNNITLINNQSNLTFNITTLLPPPANFYIIIYIGISSVLWYVLLPLFIFSLILRIIKNLMKEYDIFFWIGAFSLINVLNGPLDWYYIYTLPWLYILLSASVFKIFNRHSHIIASALVLIQLIQFVLFFSGIIPSRIDIIR